MSNTTTRRTSRSVAVAALGLALAGGTVAAGLGAQGAAAQVGTAQIAAAPGVASSVEAAAVAKTPAAQSFGSGSLLQTDDFWKRTQLDTATIYGNMSLDRQALSACTGEHRLPRVIGAYYPTVDARWTSKRTDEMVTQTIVQGESAAEGQRIASDLNHALSGCQNEPKGHWYYGTAHKVTVGTGSATWYVAYNGDGVATGGVAVVRNGRNAGIFEISASPSAAKTTKALAVAATKRLA